MAGRAPQASGPGEVGPPSGWSPVARMSGRRPGRSLPCPPRPVRRAMSVQPVERTSSVHASGVHASGVQASGVQASGASRCPDGQAPVSAALPPPCPRPGPRSGSVWRTAPAGRSGSTCPRGLWAAWSPACIGPDGKGMLRRWPWLARMRSTVARAAAWPAFRLRSRLGPSGPTRALVQGQGAGPDGGGARDRAGVHRSPQGVLAGRRRGADQGAWTKGVVTTLSGRWARGGPVAGNSGGPTRSVGEQPAAAARPQRVRSAVR